MGVLLMLMTIGGVFAAVVLLAVALYTNRAWLAKFTAGAVAIWFAFYALTLVGTSLTSSEKLLGLGETKEYCGFYLDCHMHAAVVDVNRTKELGNRTASGEFYLVTVEVSSDARRAKLGLLSVDAGIEDANSAVYHRDTDAELQLPPQPEFERQIGPEESFRKTIVFDLPRDMPEPRLDLREGYGIDHIIEAVLIGDEDSIFHKRNYFKLREQNVMAGVQKL